MGGVPAARKVLAKAGLDSSDSDLIEINEAFGPLFLRQKKARNKCGLSIKPRVYQSLEVILKTRTEYRTFINVLEV